MSGDRSVDKPVGVSVDVSVGVSVDDAVVVSVDASVSDTALPWVLP